MLFYGPQRYRDESARRSSRRSIPRPRRTGASWMRQAVHVDLHGMFLSPDFDASSTAAGTWRLQGRSGCQRRRCFPQHRRRYTFHPAGSISSLSTVNIAGVASQGGAHSLAQHRRQRRLCLRDGGQTGGRRTTAEATTTAPSPIRCGRTRCSSSPHAGTRRERQRGSGPDSRCTRPSPAICPDISSSGIGRSSPAPRCGMEAAIWNATNVAVSPFAATVRSSRTCRRMTPLPTDRVFIRFFGNFPRTIWPGTSRPPGRPAARPRPPRYHEAHGLGHAGGWRVDRHPRFLADITGDGTRRHRRLRRRRRLDRAEQRRRHVRQTPQFVLDDFGTTPAAGGSTGTRASSPTSPATAGPTSSASATPACGRRAQQRRRHLPARRRSSVLSDFGYEAGGWRVDQHPRFLADLTGDGRADIVGFGDAGVWVALSNGDGTFQHRRSWSRQLRLRGRRLAGRQAPALPGRPHRRRPGRHRRLRRRRRVGRAQQRRRHLQPTPSRCVDDFGYDAGGWRVDRHPRFLADLTGDGRADIVGFGDDGVWVALSNGDGTFQPAAIR